MKHLKTFEGRFDTSAIDDTADSAMDSKISIEMDTAVDLDGDNIIVYNADNAPFLDKMEELNIQYKVIDPHGPAGGNPVIEYTGYLDSIKKFMVNFDAYGRPEEELMIALIDWTGDEEELFNIIS